MHDARGGGVAQGGGQLGEERHPGEGGEGREQTTDAASMAPQ